MVTWRQIQRFLDKAWVEWGMFTTGVILIIIGFIVAPLPGPGGIFLLAPGFALVLKASMWAKRHYVRLARWQPKAGELADRALRRSSVKRRAEVQKSRRAGGSN